MQKGFQFVAILALIPAATLAQPAPTTVQLPTFQVFTVDTTVLVPDAGTASLAGGSRTTSTGSTAYGPGLLPGTRASGAAAGAGQVSIHAQIHDLGAMDAALLGGGSAAPADATRTRPTTGDAPAMSVSQARRLRAADDAAKHRQAQEYMQLARAQEKQHRFDAARGLYRTAMKLASPAQQQEIRLCLAQLSAQAAAAPAATAPARP